MSDKVLSLMQFGDRTQVSEIAQRIADFLPGAKDVPPEGRLALAQIAITHGLDPFTGEAWAIPQKNMQGEVVGFRLMVGIAGWRAHAHRTGEYCGRHFVDCSPEERAALGAGQGDLAIKCIVVRRKAGSNPMQFDGFGVFKRGEKTKMNPLQCVRFRGERDAMKAAFPLGAGGGLAAHIQVASDDGEIVEGDVSVVASTSATYGAAPITSTGSNSGAGNDESQKTSRPYAPAILKAKLGERAKANASGEVNSQRRGLFAANLEEAFAPDADSKAKRHAVMAYLFGVESVKDMTAGQVLAGLEWLKPAPDERGDYHPDSMAAREATMVLAHATENAEQSQADSSEG